jgi:hypothetical protein
VTPIEKTLQVVLILLALLMAAYAVYSMSTAPAAPAKPTCTLVKSMVVQQLLVPSKKDR